MGLAMETDSKKIITQGTGEITLLSYQGASWVSAKLGAHGRLLGEVRFP